MELLEVDLVVRLRTLLDGLSGQIVQHQVGDAPVGERDEVRSGRVERVQEVAASPVSPQRSGENMRSVPCE